MPDTFKCPSCGAPLDYKASDGATVRCSFCASTVIIPQDLRTETQEADAASIRSSDLSLTQINALKEIAREMSTGRKIAAIKIYRETFGTDLKTAKEAIEALERGQPFTIKVAQYQLDRALTKGPAQGKSVLRGCLIIGLTILVLVLALVGFLPFLVSSVGGYFGVLPDNSLAVTLDSLMPTPGFASIALTFGDEGIGPGHFTDARHIAVDGAGNIYVGEWEEGSRIQVFTPNGEFVSLWRVADLEAIVTGLAADRQGIVYVIQKSRLSRYDGATGEFLGQVTYADKTGGFEDVVATADGGVVAFWNHHTRQEIIHFNAQVEVVQTINFREQIGDSVFIPYLAVDGLSNIYVLDKTNAVVLKLGPDGHFIDKFGGRGDQPGQFSTPDDIAVDGQGRVYIGDRDIQVFDADGRYLDTFAVDGPAFGMTFNDNDELFIAGRTRVIKFVLNEQ